MSSTKARSAICKALDALRRAMDCLPLVGNPDEVGAQYVRMQTAHAWGYVCEACDHVDIRADEMLALQKQLEDLSISAGLKTIPGARSV